jgi:thiol-disulfide isomerase/thioredoxin
MHSSALDRRTTILGMAGLALAGPALGDEPESPIAHGILEKNALALKFEKARSELPDVRIVGPNGDWDIASQKGRTILMPIWAEWCAPCLSEIPDFARLQQKYGGDKFAIIPVLSGTRRKMTFEVMTEVFVLLHAGVFEPIMERNFGSRLVEKMAEKNGSYSIPCNLLIAPDGRVVGREMGRISSDDASSGPAPAKTKDPETVTRAMAGQAQSLWGKDEGEEFAAAMANGFLT